MANLDEILNFAIPALLIIVVCAFIYTKFLKPWLLPHLVNLWEWITKPRERGGSDNPGKKEIIFE